MKIFYLDTSSNFLYTGIVSNGKLICDIKLKLDKDLSSFTLPKIEEMFSANNMNIKDIDKIIVVNGPGSFTGVRIGMTIAKVMAWSLNKELVTISSLDAMANSTDTTSCNIVPIINARRDYVYGAIYDSNKNVIIEGQYIMLNELLKLAKDLSNDFILVTNDSFTLEKNTHNYVPNILNIVIKYQNKQSDSVFLSEPNYLKLTEAEENKNRSDNC